MLVSLSYSLKLSLPIQASRHCVPPNQQHGKRETEGALVFGANPAGSRVQACLRVSLRAGSLFEYMVRDS